MINPTDLLRFSQVVTVLEAAFDKELSQPAKDAYWIALEDLSIDEVEIAGQYALRQCRFFPKPAELRELVQGTSDDAAMKAWTELLHAFLKAGYWTSVLFEDGALATAIEYAFGTWVICSEQLHTLSDEMLRAKQKEFAVQYRRALREGKAAAKYLRGYCEIANLETVGKWNRGEPITEADRTFFRSSVFIQGVTSRMVDAEFDFYSGVLQIPLIELASRPAVALPATPDRKLIGDGTEPIDQEAGRQMVRDAVKDLTGFMRMPQPQVSLTEEQWQARREALKRQAEAL